MDVERCAARMEETAAAVRALVQGLTGEQARRKPDAGSWSVLEVINHLRDEEREDFWTRLDYTLYRPGEPWPPTDPEGWVTERRYNDRDLVESLDGYLAARQEAVRWLRSLESPDWDATHVSPWGTMTAGDVLAAWVAHDILHLRQLVELRWALTRAELEPRSVDYAGRW